MNKQLDNTHNIAIDLIITAYDSSSETLKIYAPERTIEPFMGERALPGVLMKTNETVNNAVKRTLDIKTNLQLNNYKIEVLVPHMNPNRDERGHVIGLPIIVLAQVNDFQDGAWITMKQDLQLAFDHANMVNMALNRLSQSIRTNPIAMFAVAQPLTTLDLHGLYKFLDDKFDIPTLSNFIKISGVNDYLKLTGDYKVTSNKGRRPALAILKEEKLSLNNWG